MWLAFVALVIFLSDSSVLNSLAFSTGFWERIKPQLPKASIVN